MILTRTPFRISFFGGGTDYPQWYESYGGKVLAATIDKYCYISVRELPPFFEHKFSIVYSRIENIDHINDIKHPAVREVLRYHNCKKGLVVKHDGDLPARSGLGSSSSFTVGLLNALSAFNGECIEKYKLAKTAIHVEQDLIKECVGSQDQISAAYGGVNEIEFYRDSDFSVVPLVISNTRLTQLNDHLMLFFTGITRIASEIAKSKVSNFGNNHSKLLRMRDMVDEGISILRDKKIPIQEFGQLLHEAWTYKISLSEKVTSQDIDDIYKTARDVGAIGGKILGAGGGGFLLLFVNPNNQDQIRNALSKLVYVPFRFEYSGSQVVLSKSNGFHD